MTRTTWMLGLVALIAIVPLFIGGEFGGTDDMAGAVVAELSPGHEPWFTSIWEPPSGEIESLLFTLQAVIGALVIGYAIGRRHGRSLPRDPAPAPVRPE